jgi:hypothetical protein
MRWFPGDTIGARGTDLSDSGCHSDSHENSSEDSAGGLARNLRPVNSRGSGRLTGVGPPND